MVLWYHSNGSFEESCFYIYAKSGDFRRIFLGFRVGDGLEMNYGSDLGDLRGFQHEKGGL